MDSLNDVLVEARKISMSPYLVNISGHWAYKVISLEDLEILPAQHDDMTLYTARARRLPNPQFFKAMSGSLKPAYPSKGSQGNKHYFPMDSWNSGERP
jgi:hypothetical protein